MVASASIGLDVTWRLSFGCTALDWLSPLPRQVQAKSLGLISQLEGQPDLPALDSLLRRIALTYYPRNQVAGLSGEAWLVWLDEQADKQQDTRLNGKADSSQFMPLKESWLSVLYGNKPLEQEQWQAFIAASRHWVLHFKTEGKC